MNKVNMIQKQENPIPVEILAESIQRISDGMKTLTASRLRRSAIVALIHDTSKLARRDIEIVLNNLETLEATWLKPKKQP